MAVLKAYEVPPDWGDSEIGLRDSETKEFVWLQSYTKVNLATDVDALIAEKDKRVKEQDKMIESAELENARLLQRIAELEAKLPKWYKVSEKLPKEASPVLVVCKEQVHFCFYSSEVFFDYETTEIFSFKDDIMWCERPQPPKEG